MSWNHICHIQSMWVWVVFFLYNEFFRNNSVLNSKTTIKSRINKQQKYNHNRNAKCVLVIHTYTWRTNRQIEEWNVTRMKATFEHLSNVLFLSHFTISTFIVALMFWSTKWIYCEWNALQRIIQCCRYARRIYYGRATTKTKPKRIRCELSGHG